MKMRIFYVLLFCYVSIFAQEDKNARFSFVEEFDMGSNFGIQSERMTCVGMNPVVGVEITKKIRIGVPIGYYFMLFSDNGKKMRDLTNGMGIAINFLAEESEKYDLRVNVEGTYDNSNRYRQDWYFFKKSISAQYFPKKIASEKIRPFFSIGIKHYTMWAEDSENKVFGRHNIVTPYVSLGLVYNY